MAKSIDWSAQAPSHKLFLSQFSTHSPNWMTRTIQWIRAAHATGVIRKTVVYTLVFFASLLLLGSVLLSPIFLYGFAEYVIQEVEERHAQERTRIAKQAEQYGHHLFLKGRLDPFRTIPIPITPSVRAKIIRNLELSPQQMASESDSDLARRALLNTEQFFDECGLKIVPKGIRD